MLRARLLDCERAVTARAHKVGSDSARMATHANKAHTSGVDSHEHCTQRHN